MYIKIQYAEWFTYLEWMLYISNNLYWMPYILRANDAARVTTRVAAPHMKTKIIFVNLEWMLYISNNIYWMLYISKVNAAAAMTTRVAAPHVNNRSIYVYVYLILEYVYTCVLHIWVCAFSVRALSIRHRITSLSMYTFVGGTVPLHTWQCVAVCCSVLQCVEVCCRMFQDVAGCCSVLQSVAVPLLWVLCHFTGVLDWFEVDLSTRLDPLSEWFV